MERDGEVGVRLGVSNGYAGRLEVVEGPTGRCQRSAAERARIAAEGLLPGVRVTDVARRHGVTRWQVYDWRKQLRNGRLMLPESVTSAPAFAALMVEEPSRRGHANARIEIVVDDVVIRAEPGVDGEHLTRVIRAIRAAT